MTYTFKLGNRTYKVDFEEKEGLGLIGIDGEQKEMEFLRIDENTCSILVDNRSVTVGIFREAKKIQVFYEGDLYEIEAVSGRDASQSEGTGSLDITAPMHSRVVKILKKVGDNVEVGDSVIVVEAMKMESELKASASGTIKEIRAKEGETVEKDSVLVALSDSE
ncbi:MAG: hypothetical protein OXI02_04220 [Candidatus Dadabacteria bacterium]|nr:hypothetical protein [Candidatus Dadabacteria bacterium]MDE0477252.1 hypothetical protein [Candidatus Dadabacteria bacterium]